MLKTYLVLKKRGKYLRCPSNDVAVLIFKDGHYIGYQYAKNPVKGRDWIEEDKLLHSDRAYLVLLSPKWGELNEIGGKEL